MLANARMPRSQKFRPYHRSRRQKQTFFQKILAPIKIKLALPSPTKPKIPPPPLKEEFYGHGFFPAERTHFSAHKIGAAISGPRVADTNFTDTRIIPIFSRGDTQKRPRQTKPKKGQFMNFSQGLSGTKVQCESCSFS